MNGERALSGRRVLVTGGASRIGRAVTQRLWGEGALITVVDRDANGVTAVASELPGTLAIAADVARGSEIAVAVARAEEHWNGLDAVVAAAGIQLIGQDAPVDQLDQDVWHTTIATNLTGTYLACKYAVAALKRAGGGSFVLIGSPTGMRGTGFEYHAYTASKAGVMGLGRAMAVAYAAAGIRVNLVVPGFTRTPLVERIVADSSARNATLARVPMGRLGRPEEIASVVSFLISDEGSFVTGATWTVDGGETAL